jgi:hypothetical protein
LVEFFGNSVGIKKTPREPAAPSGLTEGNEAYPTDHRAIRHQARREKDDHAPTTIRQATKGAASCILRHCLVIERYLGSTGALHRRARRQNELERAVAPAFSPM